MTELTKDEQQKFDQASTQIFDYYDMAYGRTALGQFMEAIEQYPELPLKDIYDLMYEFVRENIFKSSSYEFSSSASLFP